MTKQRIAVRIAGLLLGVGLLGLLTWGATRTPTEFLTSLERWHPLTEVLGWFVLGMVALYLAYQANQLTARQTELAEEQLKLSQRERKIAEDQLLPRLRVRIEKEAYGDLGRVSSFAIENVGGDVEELISPMQGSALVVERWKIGTQEKETSAFPMWFFGTPRYLHERTGVLYENRALYWSKEGWASRDAWYEEVRQAVSTRLGSSEARTQVFVYLRHFVEVAAEGAFGGRDWAVFEVTGDFDSVTLTGGRVARRIPVKEGGEVIGGICGSMLFVTYESTSKAVDLICTFDPDGKEEGISAGWRASVSRLTEALARLDALEKVLS